MSLAYIINEICEKTGYVAANNREILLKLVNRAAKEVYEYTDLPGCLMEVTVLVSADSLAALPSFVGELRNIRAHYTWERLALQELAAKYSFQPWPELWNNWCVVNKSPIQHCIENAVVPLVLTMDDVDTVDVAVTVTGKTATSNRISETVTLVAGETQVQLSNSFIDIYKITKDIVNNLDITLTGADEDGAELELAVIPNDQLQSLYTIIDVSSLPYGGDQGTTYRYIDVLYKAPLPQLSDDGDEFICPGFDDAIVAKACQFFNESKEDGAQMAINYGIKCNQIIAKRIEHSNGATEKKIVFAPEPLYSLYPKGWNRGLRRALR